MTTMKLLCYDDGVTKRRQGRDETEGRGAEGRSGVKAMCERGCRSSVDYATTYCIAGAIDWQPRSEQVKEARLTPLLPPPTHLFCWLCAHLFLFLRVSLSAQHPWQLEMHAFHQIYSAPETVICSVFVSTWCLPRLSYRHRQEPKARRRARCRTWFSFRLQVKRICAGVSRKGYDSQIEYMSLRGCRVCKMPKL